MHPVGRYPASGVAPPGSRSGRLRCRSPDVEKPRHIGGAAGLALGAGQSVRLAIQTSPSAIHASG